MNTNQPTFAEKQQQANSIEGEFDAVKDRAVAAGNCNTYSDEEVSAMRAEMSALSRQYFDLTGLTLE